MIGHFLGSFNYILNMGRKIEYFNGQTIGECIFIKEIPSIRPPRRAEFKCKCGKLFQSDIISVKTGDVRSCRCALLERKKQRFKIICACGCGKSLINIDGKGRNRLFIHGHNKANSGNTHTIETKNKISTAKSGKIIPLEIRLKMGSKREKNPNWKGGVTSINETIRKSIPYKEWRNSVFKRDNFTCVWCGEKDKVSGKLQADHIKPFAFFPELRLDIDNGRTLCKECHSKTDTYLVKAIVKYKHLK